MREKRFFQSLCMLGICIFMLLIGGMTVKAETSPSGSAKALLNLGKEPSSEFLKYERSGENPFGAKDGETVRLATLNELAIYKSYDTNNGKNTGNISTTVYSKWNTGKNISNTAVKDMFSDSKNISAKRSLSFMKGTAIQSKASKRDDAIVYAGVNTIGQVSCWKQNLTDNTASDLVLLDAKNLSETLNGGFVSATIYNNSRAAYEANSMISITSGDYSGDGEDHVVVGFSTKALMAGVAYNLVVLRELDQNLNIVQTKTFVGKKASSMDGDRDIMGVSLSTGDYNGDKIEDLSILTTYGKQDAGHMDTVYPRLYAIRGSEDQKILSNAMSGKSNVSRTDGKITMYGAGLASGDINGDGTDEIIVAGHNILVGDKNKFDYDDKYISVACYVMANSTNTPVISQKAFLQHEANVWTREGIKPSLDKVWDSIGVECVAINGKSSKEFVFIGGTLYDLRYTEGELKELYTPAFFSQNRKIHSNVYISSVAAGTFDGNVYGREQLIFTVAEKEGVTDNYTLNASIIGGKDYGDQSVSAITEKTGLAQSYYTDSFGNVNNVEMSWHGEIENKGDDLDEQLNYLVIPVDVDDDGLLAKYISMGCYYSEPKVDAVLQATPRFEEIDQAPWTTTYGVTTSFGDSIGSSETNSWNIGASLSFSIPIIKDKFKFNIGADASYVSETTKSFITSVSNSYSTTFEAAERNTVIVKRTPVYTFRYKITGENQKWNLDKNQDYIDYSVVQDPMYFQLSIDEYNNLVDLYNSTVDNSSGKGLLKKVDETYLKDNEGDPTKYKNDFTGGWKLSTMTHKLGYNAGQSYSGWEKEEGKETDIEKTEGFSLTGNTGFTLGEDIFELSIYGGYDKTTGDSFSTSSGLTTSTSGSVCNIDEKVLMSDKKYSKETIEAYGFDWQFGEYVAQLNTDGSTTRILGYALKNVTKPAVAPENLKVTDVENHAISLSWDNAAPDANDNKGYNVYEVKDGEYNKINENIITDTKYTVADLKSDARYTYVVTAVTKSSNEDLDGVDSIWSEEATGKTTSLTYSFSGTVFHGSMKVSVEGAESKDYKASDYEDLDEKTKLGLTLKAEKGYTLNYVEVQKGSKKPYKVELLGAQDKAIIVVDEDTTVKVYTKPIINKTHLEYGVWEGSGSAGEIHGTITASVGGVEVAQPGAEVKGNAVKLEVKPDEGYVLKGWIVEGLVETDTNEIIPAIGETTLDYYFTEESTSIYAIFVKETDPEVSVKLTPKAKGGTIHVKDQDGKEYKANEDGDIYVLKNQVITITNTPDKFHAFYMWGNDLVDYIDDKSITMFATEDKVLGAKFFTPVEYRMTYSKIGYNSEDSNGTMTVTYKDSDDKWKEAVENSTELYLPYTTMKAHIEASYGYRIKSLNVHKGNVTTNIEMDPGTTKYDYPFELSANTYIYPEYERTYEVVVRGSEEQDNAPVTYDNGETAKVKAGTKAKHIFTGWVVTKGKAQLKDPKAETTSFVVANRDVKLKATWEEHDHSYEKTWTKDKTYHWHKSTCGHNVISGKAKHTASAWIVDKKATTKAVGSKHKQCTVCGYVLEKGSIPKLKVTAPAIPELFLIQGSTKTHSATFKWNKVKDATGYEVYFASCKGKYKKVKTLSASKRTWTKKNLKKYTCYKCYVKAYKKVKGKKKYLKSSLSVHVATLGGTYTNVKSVKVNITKATIKVRGTKKIKASVSIAKKKRLMKHVPKIAYKSSSTKIATVSKSGKITGKKKGTCYIYVYAANGVYKRVKVTVK